MNSEYGIRISELRTLVARSAVPHSLFRIPYSLFIWPSSHVSGDSIMRPARFFFPFLILLVTTPLARAQKANLTEADLLDANFQISLKMTLDNGKIEIQTDNGPKTIERAATAEHEYFERVLRSDKGLPTKAARVYSRASAKIKDG